MRKFLTICLVAQTACAQAQTDTATTARNHDSLKLFLQPVEVRALRAGEKAPFTKTDIGKAQIEQTNIGQDLPFLLNQTPSVVSRNSA